MPDAIMNNLETILPALFIILDIGLTRWAGIKYKGVLLRLLSAVGEYAATQVIKGDKSQKGESALRVLPAIVFVIFAITISCAGMKNVGDGVLDENEAIHLKLVASVCFAVRPTAAPVVKQVTALLLKNLEEDGTPILLGSLNEDLASRVEALGLVATTTDLFSSYMTDFIARARKHYNLPVNSEADYSIVVKKVLTLLNEVASTAEE